MDSMTKTNCDLPEILLNIAIHLAPADLARACRVSRGWFVPFASELWRSIKRNQWKDEGYLSALPHYADFVRELRYPSHIELDALEHSFNQLTLFRSPDLVRNNLNTIEQILKRNLDVRHLNLSFDLEYPEDASRITDIIRTVGKMKKMNYLELKGLFSTPGDLGSLLGQLPELESLVLTDCSYIESQGAESSSTDIPGDSASQLEYPQQARQLRHLYLDRNHSCLEIILEIARRSPQLRDLVLVNMTTYDFRVAPKMERFTQELGSYCQHLELLVISGCRIHGEGLGWLLSTFPRLISFQVQGAPMRHKTVLKRLLLHEDCYGSLESVSVERSGSYHESSTNMTDTVLSVLRLFTNLKWVHLRQCRIFAADLIGVRDEYGYIIGSEHLETLELTLIGPHKSWVPTEVHSEEAHAYWAKRGDGGNNADEKPDHSLYNRVMDELRRHPKLDVSTVRFF